MISKDSQFKEKVIRAVKMVPFGKVASYGQVALMIGVPRAARQVGWTLHGLEELISEGQIELPWWRIVNNEGRISIKGSKHENAPLLQKAKLEAEGVVVNDDLTFDIEKYRYRPEISALDDFSLESDFIQKLIDKGFV